MGGPRHPVIPKLRDELIAAQAFVMGNFNQSVNAARLPSCFRKDFSHQSVDHLGLAWPQCLEKC